MKDIYKTISEAFGPVTCAFVIDSVQQMIPWLITMFFVILCDLVAGIRRSFLMGEEVRFSRAWRRSMGKTITYFSFVIMVVMINVSSGKSMDIDIYACLFVCLLEICSIISNFLKPKGYNINFAGVLKYLCGKFFNINGDDVNNMVIKHRKNKR